MTVAHVYTVAFEGIEAREVDVQVHIGEGGMGTVYKALQPSLNRTVAIKTLPPKMVAQPELTARFGRETQALARLNHPNIVNIIDSGMDGEALLVSLGTVAVSSGAACTQAEPSHVLLALGHTRRRALASLRFGLGRGTTAGEIDRAAGAVVEAVSRLRHLSPVHVAG